MNKIEITKPILGIYAMQVCAIKGLTDEEILEVCNTENPAGTTAGWTKVYREEDDTHGKNLLPVQCKEYEDREHLIIMC